MKICTPRLTACSTKLRPAPGPGSSSCRSAASSSPPAGAAPSRRRRVLDDLATSLRSTTAPGVTARSFPTLNTPDPPGPASPVRAHVPRPLPGAPGHAFAARVKGPLERAGLLQNKLVGAAALITMLATNRARSASCQLREPRSRLSTRCPTDSHRLRYSWPNRRNAGFCAHAGSAKRRRPWRVRGWTSRPRCQLSPAAGASPGPRCVAGPGSWPSPGAAGHGGNADRLAGLDDAERLILVAGRSS